MPKLFNLKENQIDDLAILAKEIWHECFVGIISYEQIEYMTDNFLSPKAIKENLEHGYLYRLLIDGDKIIGFTASVKQDNKIFLSKLYLLKEYRGNGYGKMMVNDVISKYKAESIYLTVNKYNNTKLMYDHLGFKVIDSVVSDIGNGYVMDDYIMSLDLR